MEEKKKKNPKMTQEEALERYLIQKYGEEPKIDEKQLMSWH